MNQSTETSCSSWASPRSPSARAPTSCARGPARPSSSSSAARPSRSAPIRAPTTSLSSAGWALSRSPSARGEASRLCRAEKNRGLTSESGLIWCPSSRLERTTSTTSEHYFDLSSRLALSADLALSGCACSLLRLMTALLIGSQGQRARHDHLQGPEDVSIDLRIHFAHVPRSRVSALLPQITAIVLTAEAPSHVASSTVRSLSFSSR